MTTTKTGARLLTSLGAAGALLLSQAAFGATTAEKQAELRKMCDEALAVLYKARPEAKAAVEKSAGYGCFTSFGMSFFVGGAGGHGLVHANAGKKVTYMKMAQASGGLDFGIKDYREVLVFKDAATLAQFVDKGWEMSGGGSASAMAGGKGATKEDAAVAGGKLVIYPMTKTGLAVGVSATGRKYWKDDELNAAK